MDIEHVTLQTKVMTAENSGLHHTNKLHFKYTFKKMKPAENNRLISKKPFKVLATCLLLKTPTKSSINHQP